MKNHSFITLLTVLLFMPAAFAGNAQSESTSTESYQDSMISVNRGNSLGIIPAAKEDIKEEVAVSSNSLVDCPEKTGSTQDNNKQIVVVYFSAPENTEDGLPLTGASRLVREEQSFGNTEFIASYIADKSMGQLCRIISEPTVPADHDSLIDASISSDFFSSATVDNPDAVLRADTVILAYPVWWNDTPAPVAYFLKNTDLSGKRILPVCTKGEGSVNRIFDRLKELEPNAVIEPGLEISRNSLSDESFLEAADQWLEKRGLVR